MRYAVAALLAVHGSIHAIGFAGAWGLAEFEGASPAPTNLVDLEAGSSSLKVLGLVWLLALVAFLAAALLLVTGNASWRPAALVAAAISMVPVALWWQDAPMGAVANALVVVAVLFADRWESVTG